MRIMNDEHAYRGDEHAQPEVGWRLEPFTATINLMLIDEWAGLQKQWRGMWQRALECCIRIRRTRRDEASTLDHA